MHGETVKLAQYQFMELWSKHIFIHGGATYIGDPKPL